MSDFALQAAASLLGRAQRILVVTGAGISAESGLPTYRGTGGLYEGRRTAEGLRIEEALSAQMMARRPELTWKYLAEIEANCRGAQPNAAHRVLVALEAEKTRLCVLTQNVDGLHAMAGSRGLIEIHGSLHRLRCTECSHVRSVTDSAGLGIPPECPVCGGMLRPDVVLFGEQLPMRELTQLDEVLAQGVDLVMTIGTSSAFAYIVEPVLLAARAGVPTIEINPEQTAVSAIVDVHLRMSAARALPALWQLTHDGAAPA